MKNAILKAAETEFLEKGFVKSSLRTIVKNAGTTIGNFYNYFDNKESVFSEIVDMEYREFVYFLEQHERETELGELENIEALFNNPEILYEVVKATVPSLTTRFVILLEGSEGTGYANSKSLLIEQVHQHFMEHVEFDPTINAFGEIIATQFINGITTIIRIYHSNEEIKKKLILELFMFYILGVTKRNGN